MDSNTIAENSGMRGVYALNSTVNDNMILDNSSEAAYLPSGGGLAASNCLVTNNTVSGNSTEADGGGIFAGNSVVSTNTVTGNTAAQDGGGIVIGPGTVISNIVTGNSANSDGGGIYASDTVVSSNIIHNNTGRKGGGIYATGGSTVTLNTINSNSGRSGGGIYAEGGTVTRNTVSANASEWNGGGIYTQFATVSYNTIHNNANIYDGDVIYSGGWGGGIYAQNSRVVSNTITANTVSENGRGAGAYIYVCHGGILNVDFLYNTLLGNRGPTGGTIGGVEFDRRDSSQPLPEVHYNNLYGNDPFDVVVHTSDDISGTHNYWGTVSSVDILDQVYDWHDDSERGKFLYVPYLQEPSEDAPFAPPTGLTIDVQEQTMALSWDAHPSFTTGWGYKVYYDTDSSLPPYEGTGPNEGDAPIDVGDQTTYTLTGLDPSKDYYVAVTAYDNEGHESWYSNVEQKMGGYWVYLPVVLRQ